MASNHLTEVNVTIPFAIPVFRTQQTTDGARIDDLKLQTTENRSYIIPPFVGRGALILRVVLIGVGFYP